MIRVLTILAALAFAAPASACIGALQSANNLSDLCSAATAQNNLLPSQASNSGKFLTTDGTNVSWGTAGGVSALTLNAQTGTSYTLVNGDLGKIVTFSNTNGTAITLPQAGSGGAFAAGWYVYVEQLATSVASANTIITPTTSTINGVSAVILPQNQKMMIYSDGTNYRAFQWTVLAMFSAGGGGFGLYIPSTDTNSSGGLGNGRGSRAVDLQLARSNAAQVASGEASAMVGGGSNTASGQNSGVFVGYSNSVSGEASVAVGGGENTLTGAYSLMAGRLNSGSGESSAVFGARNVGTGYESILAGRNAKDERHGVICLGAGAEVNENPLATSCRQTWYKKTTSTSAARLGYNLSNYGVSGYTTMGLSNNSAMVVDISCVGFDYTNVTDAVSARVEGLLVIRGANAAATSLPGTPAAMTNVQGTVTGLTTTWSLTADTTNGSLNLSVTPPNTNAWTWGCSVRAATVYR